MSLSVEHRPTAHRLGTHYAIFVSAFASLVLLLLILEQLGARKLWLSHIIIAVPVVAYVGLAVLTRTLDLHEFFTAGRRVPPVFGGLALAATTLGGVGLFAFTGLIYLIGLDAMCLAIGWTAGLLLAAVLIVPYMRKSGAYTLPGFLRQRFGNRLVGVIGGLLVLPPALLLLAAELRLGAFIASLFAAVSYETALAAGAAIMALVPLLGGLRSLTWSQCVQYLVIAAGFIIPLVIVGVLLTNLPLPQLTFANIFERLSVQELATGLSLQEPGTLSQALGDADMQASPKPFLQTFGAIGRGDFILLLLCFMAGTAVLPSLLMRAGTATSVFQSRRTCGWGALFLAVFLISAPAYAAFAKLMLLQGVAGTAPSQLPEWVARLSDAGLAEILDRNRDGVFAAAEILVSGDGVALALPIIAGFPFILVALVAAAGIAATLAAGAAHAMAVGASLSDDLLRALSLRPITPNTRLLAARAGIAAAAALAAWYAAGNDFDVLQVASWAMSLAAASFLPVLLLSLCWARMTAWGAMAGMLAGFLGVAFDISMGVSEGILGLSTLTAGILGMPVSALAAVGVSLLTPRPSQAVVSLLDDIRDPSGKTILDRPVRQLSR